MFSSTWCELFKRVGNAVAAVQVFRRNSLRAFLNATKLSPLISSMKGDLCQMKPYPVIDKSSHSPRDRKEPFALKNFSRSISLRGCFSISEVLSSIWVFPYKMGENQVSTKI
jgi:hypothetical protein